MAAAGEVQPVTVYGSDISCFTGKLENYLRFVSLLLEDYADEWLWRHTELPLLPGQEEGLPFRGDSKRVGANE